MGLIKCDFNLLDSDVLTLSQLENVLLSVNNANSSIRIDATNVSSVKPPVLEEYSEEIYHGLDGVQEKMEIKQNHIPQTLH